MTQAPLRLDGHRALLFTPAAVGLSVLLRTRRGSLVQDRFPDPVPDPWDCTSSGNTPNTSERTTGSQRTAVTSVDVKGTVTAPSASITSPPEAVDQSTSRSGSGTGIGVYRSGDAGPGGLQLGREGHAQEECYAGQVGPEE